MRLRKKCRFSKDKLSDMVLLHEDVSKILESSYKTEEPSSDKFIDDIRKYMIDRPSIHKEFSPEKTFEDFVVEFCHLHLKALTMSNVLSGKEKRKDIVESVADDIKGYNKLCKEMQGDTERSVSIPTRGTGVVIYDTLEEQRKAVNKSLMSMFDGDSAMA